MAIGPAHVGVDVAMPAVHLSQLAGDEGHVASDAGEHGAAARVAGREVVGVVRGDERMGWIERAMRQPAPQVGGPVQAAEHDRLASAGRAHRRQQFRQPAHRVGAEVAVGDGAGADPACPGHVVGLVVEVEEDAAVAAVFGGEAGPECRRVICVGQWDRPRRLVFARSGPVEVEDHVETRSLEAIDVFADRGTVGEAAEARRDPVDPKPAALVQRHPDGVDVPALHRPDRGPVHRPVEDRIAFDALVLGAGAVDAEQAHRRAGAVDEVVAAHADPRLGGGGAGKQRDEEEQRKGRDEAAAHPPIVLEGRN